VQSALLLDTDLFFSVKVTDSLRHIGIETRTVRRLEDFVQALSYDPPPVMALVNTSARGVDWSAGISAASRAHVRCIAFGAHVDLATQEEARRAGAARFLSNSRLSSDLPSIVARMLSQPGRDAAG
jgi:DNA-binding NtrC family response regulator